MRSRATAIAIAIAMLAPTGALAAGPACDRDMAAKGDCCCSSGATDEPPTSPEIEAMCCCELDEAPAEHVAVDAMAQAPTLEIDPAPAAAQETWSAGQPAARESRLTLRARDPPAPRTLLAQKTLLIC